MGFLETQEKRVKIFGEYREKFVFLFSWIHKLICPLILVHLYFIVRYIRVLSNVVKINEMVKIFP